MIKNVTVASDLSMQFVAVSGYDYVVDFVHFRGGVPNFPRPTLTDLEIAIDRLCATPWVTIEADSVNKPHVYTKSVQKASLRCFEANYVLTLLRWYGFSEHEQRVLFADEISGNPVEWPMGALLNHYRGAAHCNTPSPAHIAA